MTNDCMANMQVTTICNLEGSGFGNTANEASDKRHQDMSGCRCKALEQAPNLKNSLWLQFTKLFGRDWVSYCLG